MNVWSHLPTIFNQRYILRIAGILTLCVALITTLFLAVPAHADENVTQTISFQGRLLNSSGGLVPDGNYNIQFKIYQGASAAWTETYINNNASEGVQIKNGYFSVALGSKNPFNTSIDWSQDNLTLSMNIAGSAAACTTFGTAPCVADGEMSPRTALNAVPFSIYAKNAGTLNNLSSSDFVQLAQGVQTDASGTSSIFINKTASGNLIQLQNTAVDVFTVSNNGDIMMGSNSDHAIGIAGSSGANPGQSLTVSAGTGGSSAGGYGGNLILQGGDAGGTNENGGNIVINAGAKSGTGANGTISIGSSNTSSISLGNVSTGTPITLHGGTTVTNSSESTEAFSVTTSLNNKVLTVDTENVRVGIGLIGTNAPSLSGYGLEVQGALRLGGGILGGSGTDVFTTPVGSTVGTKINIPLYDPGSYGQLIALGLPSTANSTSRVLSLFDARTGAHQPTIGVFSPNEDNLIGFSWDGSNSVASVKNTGNTLALQGGGVNILTAKNNVGVANVGIGNDASAGYALDVTGSIRASGSVYAPSFDTASAAALSIGGTNATSISLDADTYLGTGSTLFLRDGADSDRSIQFASGAGLSGDDNTISLADVNGTNIAEFRQNGESIINSDTGVSAARFRVDLGGSSSSDAFLLQSTGASRVAIKGDGSAYFRNQVDSATAFQLQQADGAAVFSLDNSNQTITFGDSTSGNYTVVSTATGKITKYGTARNTKKIALTAEYTGSVLDAGTGSNNSGVMTSSVDLTNRMNYYKWTTTQGTVQTYDTVIQIPIPTDFDGWASSNPLAISTYTDDTSEGIISLEARDSTGTVQCNFVDVTPGSTNTWATNTSACTLSTGTYTAGDTMTLRVRMQSASGGDTRIGNINLSYLSKY